VVTKLFRENTGLFYRGHILTDSYRTITLQTADSVAVERIVDHIDSIFAGFFL
jgi:hypothetical protein